MCCFFKVERALILYGSYELAAGGRKAAYVDSGTWSAKAIKEAKHLGTIDVVGSSKESNYDCIPAFEARALTRATCITPRTTPFSAPNSRAHPKPVFRSSPT